MTELKSCPFCGGEAFVRQLYQHPIVDAKHYEFCPLAYRPLPYDPPTVTRSAAIAAWNRRAEHTAKVVEDEFGYLLCSECGAIQPEDYETYYCWNCGARQVD